MGTRPGPDERWIQDATSHQRGCTMNQQGPLITVGTALICDDDPVCRMVVSEILKQCGLEVVEAATGEETLQIWEQARRVEEQPYTLIIMDNNLGVNVMTGSQCIEKLRAAECACQILMLTGSMIDEERAAEFQKAGANMSCRKPLEKPLVMSMLNSRSSFVIKTTEDTEVDSAGLEQGSILRHQAAADLLFGPKAAERACVHNIEAQVEA